MMTLYMFFQHTFIWESLLISVTTVTNVSKKIQKEGMLHKHIQCNHDEYGLERMRGLNPLIFWRIRGGYSGPTKCNLGSYINVQEQ